jgi:hypothetical protein
MHVRAWFAAWRINRKYRKVYAEQFDTFFADLLTDPERIARVPYSMMNV